MAVAGQRRPGLGEGVEFVMLLLLMMMLQPRSMATGLKESRGTVGTGTVHTRNIYRGKKGWFGSEQELYR